MTPRKQGRPDSGGAPGIPQDALLVGRSRAIAEVRRRLAALAAARVSPVLITGPAGSGKDRAARFYFASGKFEGDLVAVNMAAITEALLEDRLFGHVRGAFTGADRDSEGLVDGAQRGVLFLDEIGIAPAQVQGPLLRLVENRDFRRVGPPTLHKFNGQLLFATNRDLHEEAKHGRFLPDLLARIEREVVHLPALSERPEDIPALVQHVLNELDDSAATALGIPPGRRGRWVVTSRAMSLLQAFPWPGNVRELQQVLGRLARSVPEGQAHIDAGLVHAQLDVPPGGGDSSRSSNEISVEVIRATVRDSGGNISEASRRLGISRGRVRRALGR